MRGICLARVANRGFTNRDFARLIFACFVFVNAVLGGFSSIGNPLQAQVKFNDLPGYQRFASVKSSPREIAPGGRISNVSWSQDFSLLRFTPASSGKPKIFDLEKQAIVDGVEFEPYKAPATPTRARRGGRVPRATQRPREISNTGQWVAEFRDNNVFLVPNSKNKKSDDKEDASEVQRTTIQVTSNGTERLRYGTGCWVYGEELDQQTAMWWSPNDRYLAFYEIDERHMRDYHLTVDNTKSYTRLLTVRYPKAGDKNPFAGILVYELATGQTKRIKIDGEPQQYLYNVRWTPGGGELLVNRTNRHQNVLDLLAIDPETGKVRTVLTEKQESWQENSPVMRFLSDGKRFVWETESNGWKNFELRHLDGTRLNALSASERYPVNRIFRIDEKSGWFYYTAFSAENPYNQQLHRCRLDGTDNRRLTPSPLNHTSLVVSPDHRWIVASFEDLETPPRTILYDATGQEICELDRAKLNESLATNVTGELFYFTAADGKTEIWGTLHKPTNFDPEQKYPLLVDVYGGPGSRGISNRFRPVNKYCEFGFCIIKVGNRGTTGRGKAFESANYLKLGGPDLQDQADAVKYISQRKYIDGNRVGIFGHSYGGYLSALALLKQPEVFHVAVAGAPVTTWENYDTIYTERYMRTPQQNPDGYRAGSCMEYADRLQGKLLLVHGLIDDNVHPANTWQLAEALHAANRRFDMQIYPGFKHGIGSTYFKLRWEYLCRHLQPNPGTIPKPE